MIDLHTHTILSDGDLIPSELVRRAYVAGCKAIAITDHVDHSNIGDVLAGVVRVSRVLCRYWDILVIPGVEITHVPLEVFPELVRFARRKGAKIVVGHGESPVEPVITGTNAAAINAGVDILAHPGFIRKEDARLAAEKGVCLEITTRRGHSDTNKHVFQVARDSGAKLVLDTDTHAPEDILTPGKAEDALSALTDSEDIKREILENSKALVDRIK